MASFGVTWSNSGLNLQELQSSLSHNQSSIPGMLLYGKNSLSYRLRTHHNCNAQKLSNVVVNNFSGSSAMNSAPRSEEYVSSSSALPSVFDHGNKISTTRKRLVDKEVDFSGKLLDQWVKDSMVEIVKSLDEVPFLVHIYWDGKEGSKSTKKNKLVKEKAVPENWPYIKERWDEGISPTPNGIILVEEMKCNEEGDDDDDCPNFDTKNKKLSSSEKVWGILIQGKGANYPACYLLKTCRVACVFGFCTHFCLLRVECFGDPIDLQFRNMWLV